MCFPPFFSCYRLRPTRRNKMKVYPSVRYNELGEKKIVKLLQPICQVMGLATPDLFNYRGVAVFFILYSLLICLILLALCAYAIYFKMGYFYNQIIVTAAVLDITNTLGTTATTILCVLFSVTFRRKKIVQLVKNLKEIEKSLNEKFDVVCHLEDKGLLIQFVCLEIMVFTYIIFDTAFEIYINGALHYSWSIILHVNLFMISLIVVQVQFFSTTIKQYFAFMNDRLLLIRNCGGKWDPDCKFKTVNMKFFLKVYDKLCDVIDLVGTSYGIQIAAISFNIIMCLIGSLNLLMKFALGNDLHVEGWRYGLLAADTWNSIIYIVRLLLLLSSFLFVTRL